MKSALISVGIVLALLVAAAAVLPTVVDWNAYRQEIASALEDAIGRPVRIEGDVSLSLLPSPALDASAVRISAAGDDWSADLATVESLRLEVTLASLIREQIQVRSIALRGAAIMVDALAEELEIARAGDPAPDTAGARPDRMVRDVRFHSFTVEDGALVRTTESGTEPWLTGVNADISAQSLVGPFSAEGEALARGERVAFKIGVGRLTPEAGASASLTVSAAQSGLAAVAVGRLAEDESGDLGFDGRITLTGDDLREAAGLFDLPHLAEVPRDPFTVESGLRATAEQIAATDLAVKLRQFSAGGQAMVSLADPAAVSVQLATARLDLDAIIAELDGRTNDAPTLQGILEGFALPTDVAARLDFYVEALGYRDQVMRQVHLVTSLEGGKLIVEPLHAMLPGGAEVTITGQAETTQDGPAFKGTVAARLDDFRGNLDWLGIALPDVSRDRLRKVDLDSLVSATPSQIELTDMKLLLDGSTIDGSVAVAMRRRPSLGVGLTVDQVTLESYLPSAGEGAASEDLLSRFAFLRDVDLNLVANVGQLTVRNTTVDTVRVDATLHDGLLKLREASARDLVGARAMLSGTLSPWAEVPSAALEFEVATDDPLRLGRLAGLAWEPAARLGAVTARGTASGWWDDAALNLDLEGEAGSLGFEGRARLTDGSPWADGALDAEIRDSAVLFGAADAHGGLLARTGAIRGTGTIAGSARDLTHDLTFALEGLRLHSKGKLTDLADSPRADVALTATVTDPAWLVGALDWDDISAADLEAAVAEAHVAGSAARLTWDATAESGPVRLATKGSVENLGGEPRLDIQFDATAVRTAWILAGLDEHADVPASWESVSGTGTVSGPLTALQHDVSLVSGPLTATAQGTLAAGSRLSEFDTRVAFKARETAWLAEWLGPPWAWLDGAGPAAFEGRLAGGPTQFSITDGKIGAWGGALEIDGTADRATGAAQVDVALALSHPNVPRLATALGLAPDKAARLPAGPAALEARARGGLRHVVFEKVSGRLGESEVAGEVEIDRRRPRPYVKVMLEADQVPADLVVAEFAADVPVWRADGETSPWSDAPLDIDVLRSVNGDLVLRVKSLIVGGLDFANAHVQASLRDATLTLADLSGSLDGASVGLSGRLGGAEGLSFELRGDVAGLPIERLVSDDTSLAGLTGVLTARVDARGGGPTPGALMANLVGRGEVEGTVQGAGVVSREPQIGGWPEAVAATLGGLGDGPASLSGRFAMDQGVASLAEGRLMGDGARAKVEGTLDLGNGRAAVDVEVERAAALALALAISGPIEAPDVRITRSVGPETGPAPVDQAAPGTADPGHAPTEPVPEAKPEPMSATDTDQVVAPAADEPAQSETPAGPDAAPDPLDEEAPTAESGPAPEAHKPIAGENGPQTGPRQPVAALPPEAVAPAQPDAEPSDPAADASIDPPESPQGESALDGLIRSLLPDLQPPVAPAPRPKPLLPERPVVTEDLPAASPAGDVTVPDATAPPKHDPILDIVRGLRE